MAYTVEDITELIRYHLVAAAPNDKIADHNLAQLMRSVEPMITSPVQHQLVYWMACEKCGAWVSSELIGPDSAGKSNDGGFFCTSCRFGDDEEP